MPLNINLQQILLHWMNLAILTGGLYFLLFKPVTQFMQKREAYYKELDQQAADKLALAEQLRADYQSKLDHADEEIRQERSQAQQAAAQAAQEQVEQAQAQARHIIAKAHTEAEGKVRTTLMLGLVFIETAIIYALLVVILIIFVL